METRDRLRAFIRSSGMSQAALARKLGEDPMWVSNRLRGHSQILADEVPMLAAALGVKACAFVDQEEFERALSPAYYSKPLGEVEPRPIPSREDREAPEPPARPTGGQEVTALVPSEADLVARELVAGWDQLPERERRFLRGLAALRREYREGDDDEG